MAFGSTSHFTFGENERVVRQHDLSPLLAAAHRALLGRGTHRLDTGFVSWARGWDPLRSDDCGVLWEHLVLEHLQASRPDTPVRCWRDKSGREVDFVLTRQRDEVDAVECKWNPGEFDSTALKLFRSFYPKGRNFLVTPSGDPGYNKRFGELRVRVCTPSELGP